MRVLYIIPFLAARAGGAPAFAAEAGASLVRLGVHVTLCSTDMPTSPYMPSARPVTQKELPQAALMFDVRLFRTRPPRRLAFSPAFYRAIRQIMPACDVVHIHSLWLFPQFAAYREAKRLGIPYVVSPHGALDPYLRRRGRTRKAMTNALWQNAMLEGASALHVTTEAEAALIDDIAPQVPRAVVPCGLQTESFSNLPDGDTFRLRHLNGHRGPIVLYVGRLTFKKGIEILIRAFAVVREHVAEARLVLVGPDDENLQPRLIALASELNLTNQVTFTGGLYGEERLEALAAADVWALSSHTENFGIAVVEALAAGLPTVVSPAVNIAAEIERAGAGIVADNTPETFGDALTHLLLDKARRETLSRNAVDFARQYDWRVIAPRLADLYARVSSA